MLTLGQCYAPLSRFPVLSPTRSPSLLLTTGSCHPAASVRNSKSASAFLLGEIWTAASRPMEKHPHPPEAKQHVTERFQLSCWCWWTAWSSDRLSGQFSRRLTSGVSLQMKRVRSWSEMPSSSAGSLCSRWQTAAQTQGLVYPGRAANLSKKAALSWHVAHPLAPSA